MSAPLWYNLLHPIDTAFGIADQTYAQREAQAGVAERIAYNELNGIAVAPEYRQVLDIDPGAASDAGVQTFVEGIGKDLRSGISGVKDILVAGAIVYAVVLAVQFWNSKK